MDDVGLHLTERSSKLAQRTGHAMVRAMPGLLNVISVVGTAAMLWVGGHIILVGVDDLGWHWPYDLVHHWEEDIEHAVGGIGAALAWLANTFVSLVIGVVWGFVVVGVMHVLPFRKKAVAAH